MKKNKKSGSSKEENAAASHSGMTKAELQKELGRLQRKLARLEKSDKKHRLEKAALQESENRFNAIVSSASEAIIMTDDTGITSVWNRAAERIFGYKAKEVVGEKMSSFIIPEKYLPRHKKGIRKFRKTGKAKNAGKILELSALRKNGEEFPIEISYATPVRLNGRWHAIAVIRDISKRRKAEEGLTATLTELDIIMENTGIGIVFTKDRKIVRTNKALEKMYGYSRKQIIGFDTSKFYSSREEYEKLGREGYSTIAKGKTFKGDLRMKRADGSLFWSRLIGRAVDPENLAKGSIWLVENVSERKKIEEEVLLWADFAKSNPGPVLRCGKDGVVQVANPAAMKLFGIKKVKDVRLKDIIPDADKMGIEKFIEKDSSASFSSPVRGDFYQFVLRGVSQLGVLHIYGSDITRRKKLEERLKETLAEMQIILENARVGICLTKDEKIIWGNSKLEEILHVELEKVYGKSIEIFIPAGNIRQRAKEDHHPALEKGETVQAEDTLTRFDGKPFWGRILTRAINPKDLSKGIIWVIEDFSERKRMEDELRQAKAKAEEATKLKDKFVSLVAHDLKSPFASILGLLRLVDSDKKDALAPKHKELVGKVLKSGEGLVNMIDQLLNISRLQTGKMELKPKFIDGFFVSVSALAGFDYLAEEKGIELDSEIPRGMRLYADTDLFVEVIGNLLSNAIKFSYKGGRITLFRPPGRRTAIAVKDTGTGISEKILPKLFMHEE
ncbi:MAG: PAS domain S-box protein, partial [Nitrospinota bacterium]